MRATCSIGAAITAELPQHEPLLQAQATVSAGRALEGLLRSLRAYQCSINAPAEKSGRIAAMVIRPKSVPAASQSVLAGAERRLLGSIKRGEARTKLSANAERVRNAQLGRLKSLQLAASVPTDIDDDELQRHQDNLEVARAKWAAIPVDEIIVTYAKKLTEAT